MKHEITLLLKVIKSRERWEVNPDKIIRTLELDFELNQNGNLSVYKGEKINQGIMVFGEGKTDLFGELSYHKKYAEYPAHISVYFACTSQLLNSLIDKREELVGASVCLRLDENQSTIRYTEVMDHDLIFDLSKNPHVHVTSFSLSFVPYTSAKNGEPINEASAI